MKFADNNLGLIVIACCDVNPTKWAPFHKTPINLILDYGKI